MLAQDAAEGQMRGFSKVTARGKMQKRASIDFAEKIKRCLKKKKKSRQMLVALARQRTDFGLGQQKTGVSFQQWQ